MSLTGLSQFDTTVHATNIWLKELTGRLGWEDRHRAYQALRAVLHALRDHLTVDEVATLGAQLPLLIRGIYYEGWHPADKPLRERKKEQFLAHVASAFPANLGIDAEEVARAALEVLAAHVTGGEVRGIQHVLPAEIRTLLP